MTTIAQEEVEPPGALSGPDVALRRGAYLRELDGVRGVAILLVMLFHFGAVVSEGGAPTGAASKLVQRAVGAGWCGVDLFFVLSGFLITGILYDTKGQPGYYRTFYARRTVRIFPLYYGLLVASFLVRPWAGLGPPAPEGYQGWFWLYLANVLRVVHGGEACGRLEHFWSLAVEEHFYLIWPFVVRTLGRAALLRACVGVGVAALAFRAFAVAKGWPFAAYMLTPARVDTMAVGAWLALAARGPGGAAAVLPRVRAAAAASGALL